LSGLDITLISLLLNRYSIYYKAMRLKIGIDFHIVSGIVQGTRSHIIALFSRVIQLAPEIDFYLFLDTPDELTKLSPSFSLPNVKRIFMPSAGPLKRLCFQLPYLRKKYRLDLMHTQNNLPVFWCSRGVITRHDLLFESHPQYFGGLFRIKSKLAMSWSSKKARHLFAVSTYSKKELMARYSVDASNITVVFNGVDQQRFCPGNAGKDIIESRGLATSGYLLMVGRREPRKNHRNLVRAYSQLKPNMPLVLIGQRHDNSDDIDRLVGDCQIKDKVIFLENIGDDELAAFYRHAKLFIYPSFAEGFGMPIVEAMASGVPVICSRTTSMSEVGGDAAVFVDPGDVRDIAMAINRVLNDNDLQHRLIQAGLKNVERFSWEESARKVLDVYKKLLSENVNKDKF